MLARVESFLGERCLAVEMLTSGDFKALRRRWLAVFGVVPEAHPNVPAQYDWHTFSYGTRPCAEGYAAYRAFRGTVECDLYVISATDDIIGARIDVSKPPDLTALRMDLSVFPKDLSWTMTLTHEHGIHGPYFCRPREEGNKKVSNKKVSNKKVPAKEAQ